MWRGIFMRSYLRVAGLVGAGIFVCASAQASSSSDKRPTATQTAVTVNQVTTQSVVRVVSGTIQSSLSRIAGSGAGKQQNRAPAKLGAATGDAETGMASGDAAASKAGWGTLDYTYVRIRPDGSAEQRRLTDVYTGVAGLDGKLTDKLLGGVALSYTHATTDGRSTSAAKVDQDMDSYTVTPYLGYSISDNFVVDGLLGFTYSRMSTDDYSNNRLASGDNSARTYFGAAHASYYIPLDKALNLKTFGGFSYQRANVDSYTDSRNNHVAGDRSSHWLASVGGLLTADVAPNLSVYGGAAYEREKSMAALTENSARLTLGTTGQVAAGTSLGLEGTANVGRETQQEYGASLNLRVEF